MSSIDTMPLPTRVAEALNPSFTSSSPSTSPAVELLNEELLTTLTGCATNQQVVSELAAAHARLMARFTAVQSTLAELDENLAFLHAQHEGLMEELDELESTSVIVTERNILGEDPETLRARLQQEDDDAEEIIQQMEDDREDILDELDAVEEMIGGAEHQMRRRGAQLVRLHDWRCELEEEIQKLSADTEAGLVEADESGRRGHIGLRASKCLKRSGSGTTDCC